MIMLDSEGRAEGRGSGVRLEEVPRLLAVDYEMVVPVDKTVRLQVTAATCFTPSPCRPSASRWTRSRAA
jgi:hypothetical protein